VIIKSSVFLSELKQYISKRFFLIYGPNLGKVEYCSKNIVKELKEQEEKYDVVNVSQEEFLKENFSGLIKKYDCHDIFGKKNILVFSSIEIRSIKELIESLDNYKFNYLHIILKFENLKKKSEIRGFFEKNNDCICVPCYEETPWEKKETIKEFFKNENLEISNVQVEQLSEKLTNEKFEILFELEKIIIFLKHKKKTIEELLNKFEKTAFHDETEFIYELVSGKKEKINYYLFNSSQFQNNEIKIINFLSEHFAKLLIVKGKVREGTSLEEAMRSLKPPIFFKYIDRFKMQVGLWKENEINEVLKQLYICQSNFFEGLKSARYKFLFLILKILNKRSTSTDY